MGDHAAGEVHAPEVPEPTRATRQGAASGPAKPPATPAAEILLGVGLALASGAGLWALWSHVGFPGGTFTPGLEGHPPDPFAWARLLVRWVPAAQLLFLAAYAGLGGLPQRGPLRRYVVADLALTLGLLLGVAGLMLALRGHAAWRAWLGAWYVLFVATKTALFLRAVWTWLAVTPDGRRATAAIFLGAFVPYLLLGAHVTTAISATSDEPYYLLVAHSLLRDGDLDLADNFARRDYLPFYWGRLTPKTGGVQTASDGGIHARAFQGLQPLVLLPGYWLAGRAGAVATANLAGALALALAFRLALLFGASRRAAFLAWLGTAFSVPVLSFAASPWPEMTGALCVTAAAFLLCREGRGTGAVAIAALCLAAAVGAKSRLLLPVVPLLLGFVRRVTWLAVGAIALAAAAALALAAAYDTRVLAGSVARRVGSGSALDTVEWLLGWTVSAPTQYRGHLGLLLDQEFGLLASAPVFALALAGVAIAARQRRWRLMLLTIGPFVLTWYFLGAFATGRGPHWYGGFSPPARFVAATLPLLAVATAVTLDRIRGRLAWGLVSFLYVATLGYSLVIAIWPAWRFQHAVGRSPALVALFRLSGVDTGRLLPSYIAPDQGWVAPGVGVLVAILAAGWLAARGEGTAPPTGAWLGGVTGVVLTGAIALMALWLYSGGSYPALLGRSGGGTPFRGVIVVDTDGRTTERERLVWAVQRPSALELAPRLRPGAYRIVVRAGSQGEPSGPRLGIRLGDGVEGSVLMRGAALPTWGEQDYPFEVRWRGGRLPIRVELTHVSRAPGGPRAYVRAIEVRRLD